MLLLLLLLLSEIRRKRFLHSNCSFVLLENSPSSLHFNFMKGPGKTLLNMNQITKAAILHILASMPTKLQSLSETSRKKSSPKVLIILLETHHHLRNSILGRDKTAKTLPKDEAICESPHSYLSYCRCHSSYSEWLIHVPCGLSDQRLIIEEINFLNTAQQPLLFNLFTFSQGDICDSKAKGFTIRKGGNFDGRAGVMETKMRE